MYTRIPDRFLPSPPAQDLPTEDDVMQAAAAPGSEVAPSGGRNPSRGMSAWTRARSMSSALLGLKLLMHPHTSSLPLDPLFPPMGPPSLPGTSTPPGRARSVLHLDNQRALARQGFYGDQLPEGIQAEFALQSAQGGAQQGQTSGRKRSADDRRKQFHKTRSKRQPSLVESGEEDYEEEEEGGGRRYSSRLKSVDFSTTTESTDSGGDLSTSAPTTPGEVFLDRCPSPLSGSAFPGDRLMHDLDDLHHPQREGGLGGLRLSDRLEVDSDVTPCASRQATIEKANTLTHGEGGEEGDGGRGEADSRTSSTGTDPGRKTVSIIVSEDARRNPLTTSFSNVSPTPPPRPGPAGRGGAGGMNFLSIVHAAVDRLSDSGSDHTLVDQQSSSSGSPRPATGSESPGLFPTQSSSSKGGSRQPAQDPANNDSPALSPGRAGGSSVSSVSSTTLEEGPVLYVHHKKASGAGRDENDNLPHSGPRQGHNLHPHHSSRHWMDEDLPRMSSIQSDSSGFVDTEVSNDNSAVSNMASLKVSNLGSSCESSATMASTVTVVGSNNSNNTISRHHYYPTATAAHPPLQSLQDSPDTHKLRSKSADDILGSGSGSTSATGQQRYITMCYIPHLNKPQGSAAMPVSSIQDLVSACRWDGRHSPRGPAHIAVVMRGKGGETSTIRREVPLHNHLPLSEELAQASSSSSGRQLQHQPPSSSSGRQLQHQPPSSSSGRKLQHHPPSPSSSPGRQLQQPNSSAAPLRGAGLSSSRSGGQIIGGWGSTPAALGRVGGEGGPRGTPPAADSHSSVEGSRGGSGDELDRDDRPLSNSWWSRELPAASSLKGRRPRSARGYPGTDEESGTSVEGSSVYSCASTSDSIASGGGTPLLDCHMLLKIINQPTLFKGRRTRLVHYRPRRHLRDWPGLQKRKRLQEETRLGQYALQKFKTELNLMESAMLGRYHLACDALTPDDRDDLEELQNLWAEVRQQATETEHLLMLRMKSLAAGNDSFNFMSSLLVLQSLIDLLKEQHFQRQLDTEEEEEEEEEEGEWLEERRGGRRRHRSWDGLSNYPSSLGSWGELSRPPVRMRGRHSSSTSHLPLSPAFSDSSYDQFRSSLVSEIREEMRSNLNSLQQDLQKRDQEIHRLQLQLMMEGRSKKPRSTQKWSRSLPPSSPRRPGLKETDV